MKNYLRRILAKMFLNHFLLNPKKLLLHVLENKNFPVKMLAEAFHSENTTFEQKMSIASNKGLTSEIFKDIARDKENYLSSRLRKSIAFKYFLPQRNYR